MTNADKEASAIVRDIVEALDRNMILLSDYLVGDDHDWAEELVNRARAFVEGDEKDG